MGSPPKSFRPVTEIQAFIWGGGGGLRPTISRRGNILDHAKLLGNFFTANFDENRWFWGGTLTESLLTTPNP